MEDLRAPICFFNNGPLSPEQITYKCALYIERFPPEQFAIISFENIIPNSYYITTYGRIFTIDGRELFPMYDQAHNDKDQMIYLRIDLACTNGTRRKFYIHRLVAVMFIKKTVYEIENGKDLVNHKINRDGRCNYVWNLEWCDNEDNIRHANSPIIPYDEHLFDFTIITNRMDNILKNRLIPNRPTKISDCQAMLICHAHMILGYCPQDCARYAWLDPTPDIMKIVHSIIQGRSWTQISSKYGIIPHPHK